ncbi:poly [ADP-ribose] polymerase tankyrase-2-like isoform X10 [Ostrea edulis]|uniref:poly [ADP-ribose] polymerase tankyrase-2-like isoform X10 n=1 Tax=Ostrea edulis TaxID=37623 RepID=UPI0024AF1756|nr:poly [ADP-ribose] polymerase tankyrase-2-like isoform X10 [Ostrea edulis]
MSMFVNDQDDSDSKKKQIYKACMEGKAEELTRLVGGNVNMVIKDGLTPLHVVATSGREDMEYIIAALIKTGSDVNATTATEEDTVLHLVIKHAVLRLAFQTCLMILEHKPDLDIRNRSLRTPYDLAMAQEYFELANVLDGSMTPEEARNYYTKSIGDLYGGRLIDAVMDNNETEALDCVQQGADCNFLNKHGAGAIHYMFTNLYQHPALNLLSKMVEGGADVNLRDYEGDTPLNLAIKKTSLRPDNQMYNVVDQLLHWGADPTHKDLDGNDALALAESRKYLDVVKLLRRQKTAILTPQPATSPEPHYQETPRIVEDTESITSVIEEENPDELDDLLRDPDANLNIPNTMGLFPLHVAILRNNPTSRNNMVQQLLNNGADINVKAIPNDDHNEAGNTALHMSAARDQLDTVRILLSYNPAISPTNDEGQTPYNYAEQNGNAEMMRLLQEQQQNVERSKDKSSTCVLL